MPAYNAQSTLYDVYQGIDKLLLIELFWLMIVRLIKQLKLQKNLELKPLCTIKTLAMVLIKKPVTKKLLRIRILLL